MTVIVNSCELNTPFYIKKNHWLWIPSSGIFKCECAVPFFQLNSNTALFFCQCLSYTPTCQCKTIQSLLKTVKNTDQDRYTLCGNQSTCTSLSLKKHWSPHQEQIATSQAEKFKPSLEVTKMQHLFLCFASWGGFKSESLWTLYKCVVAVVAKNWANGEVTQI